VVIAHGSCKLLCALKIAFSGGHVNRVAAICFS